MFWSIIVTDMEVVTDSMDMEMIATPKVGKVMREISIDE